MQKENICIILDFFTQSGFLYIVFWTFALADFLLFVKETIVKRVCSIFAHLHKVIYFYTYFVSFDFNLNIFKAYLFV